MCRPSSSKGFPELVAGRLGRICREGRDADDIVVRLNAAINAALGTPKVREASPSSAPNLPAAALAATASGKIPDCAWDKIVKDANIKMHQ